MRGARFLLGLVSGWVLAGLALLALLAFEPAWDFGSVSAWLRRVTFTSWDYVAANLQGSVIPFALVLVAYSVQFKRLQQQLSVERPLPERVVRGEQQLDLCASLFFGIGVIWTAIGMRDALLHALGDGGAVAANGAFAVLQRLVDGGILLALSTTIVGGAGGYLMRAIKSLVLGDDIAALYLAESQRPERENLAVLCRIEERLAVSHPGSEDVGHGVGKP